MGVISAWAQAGGAASAVGSVWEDWGEGLVRVAAAILIGLVFFEVAHRILAGVARRTRWNVDDILIRRMKRPGRLVLALIAAQIAVSAIAALSPEQMAVVQHVIYLGIIGAFTWLVLSSLGAIEETVKSHYDVSVADNLEARRIHTQVSVLTRALHVFVIVVGLAVALMTFPSIRQLGTSLLASAGIAGLAVGLAARPVLENLIAGIQIALTQPIRLDDVVIVEGEWGRIEEITTTYVVVRIWDERRLIVPLGRFIQQPFQNWTRKSAEILGTVFLYTDYRVPVEAVREELQRIVKASDLWDGRVCGLVVTDAKEQTMELRALVSAQNSGKAWDLRVHVREKLIEFLQREHPEALPRTRVELPKDGAASAPAAT